MEPTRAEMQDSGSAAWRRCMVTLTQVGGWPHGGDQGSSGSFNPDRRSGQGHRCKAGPHPHDTRSHIQQILSRVWPVPLPPHPQAALSPLSFQSPGEAWITSPSPLSVPQGPSSTQAPQPPGSCQIPSEVPCIAGQPSTAYREPNVSHVCATMLMLLW